VANLPRGLVATSRHHLVCTCTVHVNPRPSLNLLEMAKDSPGRHASDFIGGHMVEMPFARVSSSPSTRNDQPKFGRRSSRPPADTPQCQSVPLTGWSGTRVRLAARRWSAGAALVEHEPPPVQAVTPPVGRSTGDGSGVACPPGGQQHRLARQATGQGNGCVVIAVRRRGADPDLPRLWIHEPPSPQPTTRRIFTPKPEVLSQGPVATGSTLPRYEVPLGECTGPRYL